MSRKSRFFVCALVTAAFLLAACGGSGSEIQEVTYTASEFSFEGPAQLEAGLTRIRLENEGQELHHAQLVRLEEGRTPQDLAEAMGSPHPPEWVSFAGGPSVAVPGGAVGATVDLEPGSYVLLCVIPDEEGQPHAASGMVHPIEVGEAGEGRAASPSADKTLTLRDFDFEFEEPLTPGEHTVRVVNDGPQAHEVAVVELAPDATPEDFLSFVEGSAGDGPPPGRPIGGLQVIDPGKEGYFTANFESGKEYLLICFHPDHETGEPHFAKGMMRTIQLD